jgi:hypothetical protein
MVSSQTTPAVRIFFSTSERCNEAALLRFLELPQEPTYEVSLAGAIGRPRLIVNCLK